MNKQDNLKLAFHIFYKKSITKCKWMLHILVNVLDILVLYISYQGYNSSRVRYYPESS